jgi:Peptidase family M28
MEVIRRLCSFEGRLTGTDAERRAANYLAGLLRKQGRRAEVEPTYVHPQWGLVHAVHCGLGVAGSLIALAQPAIGFALVLFAATSMYLDLNTRFYLIRRLFFRRASQNVFSPGRNRAAPARLILCAHYDVGRTGYVFSPASASRAARLQSALPFPTGPFRLLFWSLALLLPVLGLRMAGLEGSALSALQLPQTLVLVVGVFLLVDIELSPTVPGANDNASGVATALSVTEELDRDPPENLDVAALFTGAEECLQEGMRDFVRSHHEELDPERTYFLCLDTVGHGYVRYEASTGWVVSYDLDHRLVELCEAIAAADREGEDRYRAVAVASGTATDSLPPRLARYPATTISCRDERGYAPHLHRPDDLPENLDPTALERAHSFTVALVRQLDRDLGRRAVARPSPEELERDPEPAGRR